MENTLDPLPPKQRQACIGCRSIKAKCQQTDTLVIPCARCKRLSISCEFTRQKRGRKSNAELREGRTTRSASPPRRNLGLEYDRPLSRPSEYGRKSGHSDTIAPVLSFMAGGSTPSVRPTPRANVPPIHHSAPTHVEPSAGRPTGNRVDVSEYLDPGEGQPRLELTTGRRSMDDPLALGIVSAAEARTLVDLFHQHLNPPLALLDPTYHTLTFMHETSCALLTAVMAASAKFFHGPEVYRLLLDHAQVLINRAVAQGHCEIGMIQCLMVLSHFKETRDRSAWIKIGMALRFAYQNGLHKALQEVDGPQGEDARAQLNLERTWFCLNCFDSTYSNLFLLPLTIPSHQRGDVDKWAHNHLELGPACDLRLACSVEFLKTCAQLHALKVNPTTKAYRAVILTQLLSEVDRHQDKWFTGRLSRLAEHEETSLRISQFSQGLTVRMMLIDDDIDTALHLAQGLAVGSTVVGWVESIATHGNFLYCQDTTSVHLARLVVFFHNFFRRFASAQQSLAVDLMKRLNTACLSVPNMGTEGAPAFVARLIQRVLRSLSTRSMVPSRAASPSLAQPELSEAVMTGLDEFLATITAPELSTGDGQYWATLFGDTLDEFPFIGAV